jgi:Putative phage serine protease XkdF
MEKNNNEPRQLPVYELMVNECEDGTCDGSGVKFVSLVNDPAIKVDFMSFSSEEKKILQFKVHNVQERKLIGAFMIPDKEIYRRDADTGNEYYVTFSPNSISNCQKNFIKNKLNSNVDTEHSNEKVSSAIVLENWIVKDSNKDKTAAYGFSFPEGTWAGVVYIQDEKEWQDYILNGKLNGFSVEGGFIFGNKVAEVSVSSYKSHKTTNKFSFFELDLIDKIAKILLEE